MKLTISIVITVCVALRVESQISNQNNHQYNVGYDDRSRTLYPSKNRQSNLGPTDGYQFAPNNPTPQNQKDRASDSYLNRNIPNQQILDRKLYAAANGNIYYEPSSYLSPPPNASPDYYSAHEDYDKVVPLASPEAVLNKGQNYPNGKSGNEQNDRDAKTKKNNVTISISNFGLNLMKVASQLQSGNIIVSPTSIATLLALLQNGAKGETQEQISSLLQMTPEFSTRAFGTIAANIMKRNFRNYLAIANNVLVSDAFELNRDFKNLAAQRFLSEITPINFAKSYEAIKWINEWVAQKTNNKIVNLLPPEAATPNTQLMLVNTVYFKGIWDTKFKPENTKSEEFHLANGATKIVPFMHLKHAFKIGNDPSNNALIAILPFESNQYSLMLILPHKKDNVANLLSILTADHLMYYHTFVENEINLEIPKFTIKTDTDLHPVLKNMQVTNIFEMNSDLSGIGAYRTHSPQISTAVHSGFFSIDEQGATAAAATSFAAIALSYDDTTTTFRLDRPFIAILWDQQFSIPLFIAKIEDPS